MEVDIEKDMMGTGWSFPLEIDSRGGIALSKNEGGIEESIRVILGTAKGERRMRPNFGCDVHTLIFSPNNATTWGLAAHYVEDALIFWEPRIQLLGVDAQADAADPARLVISVNYRIKATNDARSIVYPFYLMGRL
jgi:phage baseplate assembly protein W